MRKLINVSNGLSAIKDKGNTSFCASLDLSIEYLHTTCDFKGFKDLI